LKVGTDDSDYDHRNSMTGAGHLSHHSQLGSTSLDNNGIINPNLDYSEIFCNMIRKTFAENIIEIISKWFPCLFR
jgi:hypothetical protein